MAQFNDFHILKELIEEGENLGLDFSLLKKKINDYINDHISVPLKSGSVKY